MKPVEECVVLAGGRGTRLQSAVSDVPKPLAPVAGRPFLAWVLDRLALQGVRHVVLATGYMADNVERAIGNRWQHMAVSYSVESIPLGTGGALRQATAKLHSDACHVQNGDTYVEYSLQDLQEAVHAAAVPLGMALVRVDDVARYGAVVVEDGLAVGFREKGQSGAGLINAGCYYLSSEALSSLPELTTFSFEQEVLSASAAGVGIATIDQGERFIDIGIPEDFLRAQDMFQVYR